MNSNKLPVMVGTAGHVDHGKTSLVRNLTNFETDHLAEEQKRGLSIDFAVAPYTTSNDKVVGIIDVPGHEDYVKNMVSGASSIDILLLVVAADDLIMPQTIEHLKIAKLLNIKNLTLVVTKIDLIEKTDLEAITSLLEEFLEKNDYHDIEIHCVSNQTKEGIDTLRDSLNKQVEEVSKEQDNRAFRMFIRHIFSIKGHGTVVTGVPSSGTLGKDSEVEILPGKLSTSIRNIENYRSESETTQASLSSAINLRNVEQSSLRRGMCIVTPGVFSTSKKLIAKINNVSADTIGKRLECRFLLGTSTAVAKLTLIQEDCLKENDSAFAIIETKEPIVSASGDLFILRSLSPEMTLAGGLVLSAYGTHKKAKNLSKEKLEIATKAIEDGDFLTAELLAGNHKIFSSEQAKKLCQSNSEVTNYILKAKEEQGLIKKIDSNHWLSQQNLDLLINSVKNNLKSYHSKHPENAGMQLSQLAEILEIAHSQVSLINDLLDKDSELKIENNLISLASFKPSVSPEISKLISLLEKELENTKNEIITIAEIVKKFSTKESTARSALKSLSDKLVELDKKNYILKDSLNKHEELIRRMCSSSEYLNLADFRDKVGTNRNTALLILEYFDREGLTIRSDEGRKLKSSS